MVRFPNGSRSHMSLSAEATLKVRTQQVVSTGLEVLDWGGGGLQSTKREQAVFPLLSSAEASFHSRNEASKAWGEGN